MDWERIVRAPARTRGKPFTTATPACLSTIVDMYSGQRFLIVSFYIDYDWRQTTSDATPINQIPYLQVYQRNAAVSAHDLQVTLGNGHSPERRPPTTTTPSRTRSFT